MTTLLYDSVSQRMGFIMLLRSSPAQFSPDRIPILLCLCRRVLREKLQQEHAGSLDVLSRCRVLDPGLHTVLRAIAELPAGSSRELRYLAILCHWQVRVGDMGRVRCVNVAPCAVISRH